MTPPVYNDADLRSEAAYCVRALVGLPDVAEILRSLPETYVESHREDDGTGNTWGDLLDKQGLADVARKVRALLDSTADIAQWAVDLGADGLEPSPHVLNLDGDDKPIVRLHMAFDPAMPERDRQRFGLALAQVMANSL